jgi:hypothetical protein
VVRYRLLSPWANHYLPALAVLAAAVVGVVVLAAYPSPSQTVNTASDPRTAATVRVEEALREAPLPPGAYQSRPLPLPFADRDPGAPNEVLRTGYWIAPGSLAAVANYVMRHPPRGMTAQSNGSGPGLLEVDFATDAPSDRYRVQLDYVAMTFGNAVALKIDALTVWAPSRPEWSFVPVTVSSGDVTVVRRPYTRDVRGAPTVRRTLTGIAVRQLAATINRLTAQAPEGTHPCPVQLLDASETVVFHSPQGDLQIQHTFGACAFNAAITADGHTSTPVLVRAADLTVAVLHTLGLPNDYGYRR